VLAEIDIWGVEQSTVQLPNGGDAFLVKPATAGQHPVIILMHERYGLVQHTKDLAVRFATEGHVALAPNLYFREPNQEELKRGEAPSPDVTDEQVTEDIGSCIEFLRGVQGADVASKLALMGVCATGRHPIVVAASRPDVAACVVFYGAAYKREWIPNDTLSGYIQKSKAPVLGVFGELDNLIAVEDVCRLRNALEAAKRSYQIKLFPDAPHGYLNDTMPGRYRRPQAEGAWGTLISFLARVHRGGYPSDRIQWSFEADHSTSYDFTKNVRME
jgi:carboxymethylenebutenolidase